MVEQFKII